MSLRSLLTKELNWSTRNVLLLVFLLLLLPIFFAGTTALFQDVLPRSVPVAVVAESDEITDSEIEIIEGGLATFTEPREVESRSEADRMLEREEVYAILDMPENITAEGESAELTFTVDGSVVPFLSPSEVITGLIESQLDDLLAADISVDREVVGEERTLSEYLYPAFLMVLVIFFALTYVPYNIKNEAVVLDRIRVESSLESLLAAKLLFFTALMTVPIIVFHGASLYYGHDISSLAPGAVFALLGTFLLLAMISATIMILSRFRPVGLFINVTLMLGFIALSALAFPLGFFSSLRTTIAQLLPTYYTMVLTRSMMLKGSDITAFVDWYAALAVLLVLAAGTLKGSIVYYRRTT